MSTTPKPEPIRLPEPFDFHDGEPPVQLEYTYRALEFVDNATGGLMLQLMHNLRSGAGVPHAGHLRILVQAAMIRADASRMNGPQGSGLVQRKVEAYVDPGQDRYLEDIHDAVTTAAKACRLLDPRPDPDDDGEAEPDDAGGRPPGAGDDGKKGAAGGKKRTARKRGRSTSPRPKRSR